MAEPNTGLAMVEIVGFRGQTAPTITYVKINYFTISCTDSEAVLI